MTLKYDIGLWHLTDMLKNAGKERSMSVHPANLPSMPIQPDVDQKHFLIISIKSIIYSLWFCALTSQLNVRIYILSFKKIAHHDTCKHINIRLEKWIYLATLSLCRRGVSYVFNLRSDPNHVAGLAEPQQVATILASIGYFRNPPLLCSHETIIAAITMGPSKWVNFPYFP